MLLVLAGFLLDRQTGATVVVEAGARREAVERLTAAGAKVVLSESSRAAMDAAMREHQAIFGGGASGRLWYGSRPPMPDGLKTLSLVLTILSQSDRPFSSVAKSMAVC
jgi:phosphomannomutase